MEEEKRRHETRNKKPENSIKKERGEKQRMKDKFNRRIQKREGRRKGEGKKKKKTIENLGK